MPAYALPKQADRWTRPWTNQRNHKCRALPNMLDTYPTLAGR